MREVNQMTLAKRAYAEYGAAFLTSVAAGLVSHMFALTNKLPNADDIEALFGKGATITSGRWGLELVKVLFPDWSAPWLYGLISILLISVAVCVAVKLLDIKSKLLQGLCGALVLSFPSLTGTFCFMFTSSAYALAFLFCVLAVYEFDRRTVGGALLGAVMLILSLSIYQAYISVTAGMFLLLIIKRALDMKEPIGRTIKYGFTTLAFMAAAMLLYFALTFAVLHFAGTEFNDYVTGNLNSGGIIWKIKNAYSRFFAELTEGELSLVPTKASRVFHIALTAIVLCTLAYTAVKTKKPLRMALAACMTLLLPLAVCCMYLVMSEWSIHTLVLYGFVCIYLLAALAADKMEERPVIYAKKLISLLMCVIAVINIYFANMCYLKLYLEFENAKSFYTVMIVRIQQTEGFNENCDLAVIGTQDNLIQVFDELDTENLTGVPEEMINLYSRERFFKYYLGFNIEFADEDEIKEIEESTEFEAMAEYPYSGSVARIGDHIVVKLG